MATLSEDPKPNEGNDLQTTAAQPAKLWGSCRLVLVILCNLGLFFVMMLRFNLSVAIVCMTKTDKPQTSPEAAALQSSSPNASQGQLDLQVTSQSNTKNKWKYQ